METRPRLLVFQDGTCNGQFTEIRSNAKILFEELAVNNGDKIEYLEGPGNHDGTSLIGGMGATWEAIFGTEVSLVSGLARKLYLKISEKYSVGDEIHLIGFSRGAFICRVVVSFIRRYGIIKDISRVELVQEKWEEYERANSEYNNAVLLPDITSNEIKQRFEDVHLSEYFHFVECIDKMLLFDTVPGLTQTHLNKYDTYAKPNFPKQFVHFMAANLTSEYVNLPYIRPDDHTVNNLWMENRWRGDHCNIGGGWLETPQTMECISNNILRLGVLKMGYAVKFHDGEYPPIKESSWSKGEGVYGILLSDPKPTGTSIAVAKLMATIHSLMQRNSTSTKLKTDFLTVFPQFVSPEEETTAKVANPIMKTDTFEWLVNFLGRMTPTTGTQTGLFFATHSSTTVHQYLNNGGIADASSVLTGFIRGSANEALRAPTAMYGIASYTIGDVVQYIRGERHAGQIVINFIAMGAAGAVAAAITPLAVSAAIPSGVVLCIATQGGHYCANNLLSYNVLQQYIRNPTFRGGQTNLIEDIKKINNDSESIRGKAKNLLARAGGFLREINAALNDPIDWDAAYIPKMSVEVQATTIGIAEESKCSKDDVDERLQRDEDVEPIGVATINSNNIDIMALISFHVFVQRLQGVHTNKFIGRTVALLNKYQEQLDQPTCGDSSFVLYFVGRTGAQKSTIINMICGDAEYKIVNEGGRNHNVVLLRGNNVAEIGDGTEASTTQFPTIYGSDRAQMWVVDTNGQQDSRETHYKVAGEVANYCIMCYLPKIDAIAITARYDELKPTLIHDTFKFLSLQHQMHLDENPYLYGNVIFVVNYDANAPEHLFNENVIYETIQGMKFTDPLIAKLVKNIRKDRILLIRAQRVNDEAGSITLIPDEGLFDRLAVMVDRIRQSNLSFVVNTATKPDHVKDFVKIMDEINNYIPLCLKRSIDGILPDIIGVVKEISDAIERGNEQLDLALVVANQPMSKKVLSQVDTAFKTWKRVRKDMTVLLNALETIRAFLAQIIVNIQLAHYDHVPYNENELVCLRSLSVCYRFLKKAHDVTGLNGVIPSLWTLDESLNFFDLHTNLQGILKPENYSDYSL